MTCTEVEATVDGVGITRNHVVTVIDYRTLAVAAEAARDYLLPLVPVEVPRVYGSLHHHYGGPGVLGHVIDSGTGMCIYCHCGGGPSGDGPCPARKAVRIYQRGEPIPRLQWVHPGCTCRGMHGRGVTCTDCGSCPAHSKHGT